MTNEIIAATRKQNQVGTEKVHNWTKNIRADQFSQSDILSKVYHKTQFFAGKGFLIKKD